MQGTIDNKNVYQLFDSAHLLSGSRAWTAEDNEALLTWTDAYVKHLQDEHVKPERCQSNNHGTYFDVQYLSVLKALHREPDVKHYLNTVVKERLRMQIVGAMLPQELVRPKSYGYANFQLEGYVRLGLIADSVGVDLWTVHADEGNSILVRRARTCTMHAHHACVCAREWPGRRAAAGATIECRECARCMGLDGAALA
jgi:hypothetical protein